MPTRATARVRPYLLRRYECIEYPRRRKQTGQHHLSGIADCMLAGKVIPLSLCFSARMLSSSVVSFSISCFLCHEPDDAVQRTFAHVCMPLTSLNSLVRVMASVRLRTSNLWQMLFGDQRGLAKTGYRISSHTSRSKPRETTA